MAERIQKLLSQWGIASRRRAEDLILAGRVALNGKPATLGDKADPRHDRLWVDGKPIKLTHRPRNIYILLNKPKDVLSTCDDPRGRKTVLDLLPPDLQVGHGLHPVGRLDRNSTGALLLTNDGELTLRLTHPRYHLSKTYDVWLNGNPSDDVLNQWRSGVELDGQKTLPATVDVLSETPDQIHLLITLIEGRNRQIRRLAEVLGLEVTKLNRRSIGPLKLTHRDRPLGCGKFRHLSPGEVKLLKRQVNLK
ncbi:MAG: hypothetical protein RLZZ568_1910 [Cyanobacteriota bacterium]|jgi:23S rRNA pseudouridine2605 synthase